MKLTHTPSLSISSLRTAVAALLLSLMILLGTASTIAATVTNTNDSGAGSLRDTVTAAAAGDTINFAVTGTITLTTGTITIDKNLTITGPGINVLTISGNDASRIFDVVAGTTVVISGLTLTRGYAQDEGGAIFTEGNLTLNNVVVSNSRCDEGSGAIDADAGILTLNNCTLIGNSAQYGGALEVDEGGVTIIINNSTISGNKATNGEGGGIYIDSNSSVTITNSTISGNTATNEGGGIANYCGGVVSLFNVTLAFNQATNDGGGIYNGAEECVPAQFTIRNTIIAKNIAPLGPDVRIRPGDQFISQGCNLIGNDATSNLPVLQPNDQVGTNANPIDPLLGTLAFNGGPTQTHALLAGSPAIDKGCPGVTTDQRGIARPQDFPNIANAVGGNGSDIGAFELDGQVPLTIQVADPAVCLDPSGLVGVIATLTNSTPAAAPASFTANLPAGLTTVPGTCNANINPGGCTLTASSVSWTGNLPAGQTVTIVYRARIGAGVAPGAQLCLTVTGTVGALFTNLNYCFNVICPAILNTRVSDQKAGSVLVFPYYTSTIGGASDTRMTISNISNAASTVANQAFVHLFFIDGTTCAQGDLFLCLTPNASFSFKASEYDPGNTGYVLAVAVDRNGVPVQNNVLIGNAFVNTPQFLDNYGAESFWANSFAVATVSGNTATLYFDQVGYDAVPKQFAVEIQSPLDAAGQQVVTAGLSGDLTTSTITGAAQVGTGQAFNEKEVFGSFNAWLTGTCQARGTISTASPRVPNGLGNLIKTGQAGYLKFNVGGAVGLLLTPRTAMWKGIRTLHKTQTVATTLTIPLFVPVC